MHSDKHFRSFAAMAIAIFVALMSAQTVFAQTETGQITGTVFDQSGAIIMGATVTATDVATKTTRTVMTTGGIYVFPSLLPGSYEISGSAPNFQTTKQTVTVAVGAKVGLDLHLSVGATTQVVEVQEEAVRVNTETQTLGATITTNEILDLPTVTRNPYDLIKTVGNTTDADPSGPARGVGVSINGLRASDVGILLDGVPNVNQFNTQVATKTPLDSVGEITVVTSNYTAEYGKALAGVINVDTKRGANDIHGSAYEFNRVSALTSNTFDNNANGIPISPFTRNQFGFSIGGPIKKNKLFVFANPEWLRIRSQATQTATIATPQLIAASAPATQAFFSAFGVRRPNIVPLQTFTYGQVCGSSCSALPSSTPVYQKVAYNVPADSGGGSPENTSQFAGRVDYVLSDKTQFYFRDARTNFGFFNGTLTNSPYVGYDTGENIISDSFALSGTHIFSPTLISQSKLSYTRFEDIQPLGAAPIAPTLYTTLGATDSLGNANILYPGYSPNTPGNSIPFGGPENTIQFNEDWTKVHGKHNLRFGGLVGYLQANITFGAYEEAVAALGTNVSSALGNLVSGQLHEFQAAIYPQGKFPCNGAATPACTLNLPVGPPDFTRSNRYHEAALYAQDSWKIRPRLTLNFGLRWEYFGPQANGNPSKDSNFYFGSGSNIELRTAGGQVLTSTSPNNPVGGLWAKDWHDFSPRLGLAWDVFGDGKTSVRGGYGIGWDPNFGNVTFNVIQNPPNYGVLGLIAGVDLPSIPITNNNAGPFGGSTGAKSLSPVTLRAVDPNIKTSYAHLWSGALEHQFTNDLIGAIEYTGSKGVNLYAINRLNLPGSDLVYAGQGTSTQRLDPQYGTINFRSNGGFSTYNAMNLRFETRNFRRQGLTLRLNYTYSHAIDNLSSTFSETSSGAGNLGLLDPLHPGLDKGSADFDVRHRITLAAIWQEPFRSSNRALDTALGGWSIIPNLSARTGTPFSIYDCTNEGYAICPRAMYDTPFKAQYTQTPNGNPNSFNYMSFGNPDSNYVNPLAGVSDFGPFPSSMTGRNAFVTPGVWNVDLAIHKNFRINERFNLQLRGEAFNVFNHSNLYIVYANTDLSSAPTNYVTATKGIRNDNTDGLVTTENRNLQLALKLTF